MCRRSRALRSASFAASASAKIRKRSAGQRDSIHAPARNTARVSGGSSTPRPRNARSNCGITTAVMTQSEKSATEATSAG